MFLHYLKQLWSQITARLSGRFHISSTTPVDSEINERLVGSIPHYRYVTTIGPTSGLASSHWLDDTRRMRAQLTAIRHQNAQQKLANEQRRSSFSTSATSSTPPPIPPKTAPIRLSHTPQSDEKFTQSPARPTQEQPTPAPQTIPLPEHALAASPASENLPTTSGHRRRLVFLKYLVRMGIYNEGFSADTTPDQYQRSLGMDAPDVSDASMDMPGELNDEAGKDD